MMRNTGLSLGLAMLAAIAVVACGGGGGSGATAGIDGTGVTGPTAPANAYSFGTVTAFGSIVVNGVHFDTSNALFTIDGQAGTQDELAVGDVVLVTGTMSSGSTTRGTADRVVFDDVVEGPIAAGSIDFSGGTFVVLGQMVRISADTSFDDGIQPASLAGLADGDIVEVSGFVASDGTVAATRIEPKPAGSEFEVTGVTENVDGAAFTFMLNALVVDYGAAMLEDFAGGVIAAGDLVEVKGTTIGGAGELIATRVEFKGDDVTPGDDDEAEVEGFVTRFVDATDFDVAGLPVTTTAQTVYEGGAASDLGLDIKVEVEGGLNGSGVLVADKVDIRRASAARIAAEIDSVSPATNSFVTLGITVKVDVLTRIEDKRDDVEPFSVANLAPGDYVEVRGMEFPAGSGELLATLVERDDADPDTELRGFVQAIDGPSVTVLGVTIATGNGTSYEDVSGQEITAGEFFGQAAVGSLVEVTGLETGPMAILADELEIQSQ